MINFYLDRIDYKGEVTPSLNTLKNLQKAHVLTVPFENLDIHIGKPIDLSKEGLIEKIIFQKRGGFCFELNGLFCELLTELGFDAQLIAARVYSRDNGYGLPMDHATILVHLDQINYLVDVGYGEFSFEPLQIELNKPLEDERGFFIIEEHEKDVYRVSKLDQSKKKHEYLFELTPHPLVAFKDMCLYHQTSPDSPFTQRRLITLPTPTGRVTLTSEKFLAKDGRQIKLETIENEEAFYAKLEEVFGYSTQNILVELNK